MKQANKPHVGAVGFEIWIETKIDLAGASSISFRVRKPDETSASFSPAISDNRDGPRSTTRYGARYVTADASDLDQAGEWEIQVVPVGLGGFTGPGEIATFDVGEAL